MAHDRFDIEKVHSNFQASLKDPADILIDRYLDGFKELNKFFHLMGSVFGFVCSDVKSKIEILETLRQQENQNQFESFAEMLEFEKSTGLLNKKDYVSGSRTLLRLHRGLAFIREFLHRISLLEPHERTCSVCQTAYNDTLAEYHPWLVRKGAVVAMYAMPTREQLLNKVCLDAERALDALPNVLSMVKTVYDRTEKMYSDRDLHALP